ncbi:hypothetical protein T4C_11842 [Trichinella pseudospiralis]|uniref:Uncharacterized protein n=1 Tax=Trichinella pseudospiralis TaxID=6337 RepID=A0A0V1GIL8_TRIPS|nr:hypothetical protein T4C_11842 [Trichinella pseudospiralis]
MSASGCNCDWFAVQNKAVMMIEEKMSFKVTNILQISFTF